MPDETARITKIGEFQYRFILQSPFRQTDEVVDGPKLLASPEGETLLNTRDEIVAAGEHYPYARQ